MEQIGSHWTDFYRILHLIFFENIWEKNSSYIETLHENQYTYWIISHSVLRRMRSVSDEYCRENQNTHFMFINGFFENRVVY